MKTLKLFTLVSLFTLGMLSFSNNAEASSMPCANQYSSGNGYVIILCIYCKMARVGYAVIDGDCGSGDQ